MAGTVIAAGVLAGSTGVVLKTSDSDAASRPLRDRVRVGAYVSPITAAASPGDLTAIEAALGGPLDIVHRYVDWWQPFSSALSPDVPARDLMISWKPDEAAVRELPSGGQDDYLDEFARAARDYGSPVYLRFGWEMNGSWMSYSAGAGGPDAYAYIAAWQHLVGRFREAGAGNVRFIWCPNESDAPEREGNRLENYWPGAAWVDVLGVDAYNWSSQQPARGDGSWRSFHEIVREPYRRVTALDPDAPVWLCEWGTTEARKPPDPAAADKARWFTDAGSVTDFPRLAALVYFSENDQRDTQRDWRLDSSPASLRAFGQTFARRSAP